MRMEQLRCLVDIAQTHSITSTAQRLYMTQQAVSSRIKQLEQDLGVELLIRTNMGVQLTAVGDEVVNYAQMILDTEQAIGELCKTRKSQNCEDVLQIRVCSTSSVTNIVLPDIVAKLNAMNRKVSLKIVLTNDIDDLLEQIQDGRCDIGFLTYNEEELYHKYGDLQTDLKLDILAEDDVVAVTDVRFIKENQTELAIMEYRDNHIITMYDLQSIEIHQEDSRTGTMVSSNDADFHRRMIEKTGAVVVMPRLAYQHFFKAKKYVGLPLANSDVSLVHAAVYRRDADIRIQEFTAMIRKELYIK